MFSWNYGDFQIVRSSPSAVRVRWQFDDAALWPSRPRGKPGRDGGWNRTRTMKGARRTHHAPFLGRMIYGGSAKPSVKVSSNGCKRYSHIMHLVIMSGKLRRIWMPRLFTRLFRGNFPVRPKSRHEIIAELETGKRAYRAVGIFLFRHMTCHRHRTMSSAKPLCQAVPDCYDSVHREYEEVL